MLLSCFSTDAISHYRCSPCHLKDLLSVWNLRARRRLRGGMETRRVLSVRVSICGGLVEFCLSMVDGKSSAGTCKYPGLANIANVVRRVVSGNESVSGILNMATGAGSDKVSREVSVLANMVNV